MSTEMVTVLLFGGLLTLLAIGVPVSFALGGISVIITFLLGGTTDLFIVATTTYRQITDHEVLIVLHVTTVVFEIQRRSPDLS